MDLSSAIATIKGYKLNEPGIRDIYNKWKLYYYYKLQHLSKTTIDYPNKVKSSGLRFINLDNNTSITGGVTLPSENA